MKSVCVIIRTYNSEKYIKRAIESVINQTYKGKIIIVVLYDNGTTDNTLSILNNIKLNETNREFLIIRHPHTSAPRSLFFLDEIKDKYDYYTFLDYDNYLDPNYLDQVMAVFKINESDFIFSDLRFVNEGGKEIEVHIIVPRKSLIPKRIVLYNFIDMNTIIMNKRVFVDILVILKSSIYMNYEWLHEDWIIGILGIYYYKWEYFDGKRINYCVHGRNINYGNRNPLFNPQKTLNTRAVIFALVYRKLTMSTKIKLIMRSIFEYLLFLRNLIKQCNKEHEL